VTDKKGGDHAILRDNLYGTTPEPTYAGVTSFMRRKYTRDLEGVDVVVSGVPLDTATTNRPGTRFGPRAIRAASTIMAWERPYGMEFDPFDKLAVVDYAFSISAVRNWCPTRSRRTQPRSSARDPACCHSVAIISQPGTRPAVTRWRSFRRLPAPESACEKTRRATVTDSLRCT